ncbi:MAG: serine/threonine protein kinase [Oscillatoriaceae bacterium SKW80]|nr:serine/threonine protein kinase [Oscillatoriaceae bacterium SKYG93]MCX8121571.1 serine/threonine protein kinase [Oscillatoriaceae bacterium SKW80]MDW8452842.1 serine/threonine-protein kinase [Oscillatoriaceae cyanobacterium SKYGB_i_bin93]HIK27916.1 serine/threonine protein kinase [Oscillatoriaceae cyanobacterium M7585_C2015_266]
MAPTLLNNRYHIIRKLGGGGFGETYLGEDTHMPSSRPCVIKQLKPVNNDPQRYQLILERFQREAAVLEDLGEGNSQIPKLYAYFSEGGQFYLIQEWIEGETLLQKVKTQGILSEPQVRDILTSLLSVLDYIHNKGIIHRDIKPDNIILRNRDGMPVLIDFGAVKETMGTKLNTQGNPTNSIVIGTPGFMPPEQAVGKPVYASDLYSLGMTAIYLLTGKLPQELEVNPRSGEIIWHQHAYNITPQLIAVLDRAIQYHLSHRYQTSREMLAALQSQAMPPTVTVATANISNMETVAVSPDCSVPVPIPPPRQMNMRNWYVSALIGGLIGAAVFAGVIIAIRPKSPLVPNDIITNQPDKAQDSFDKRRSPEPIIATKTPEITEPNSEPIVTTERVYFKRGATGTKLSGSIQTNQKKRYLIRSIEGQEFTVSVLQGNVNVTIIAPDGQTIGEAIAGNMQWQGLLPETGDYVVEISSPTASEYLVSVEVLYKNTIADRKEREPATPSKPKESPADAVQNYYSNIINNRQYEIGWNMLSHNFQKKYSADSYDVYIDWWEKVERVDLQQVKLVESGTESAVVDVELTYLMKDGRVSPESKRFLLVWEAGKNSWIIEDQYR